MLVTILPTKTKDEQHRAYHFDPAQHFWQTAARHLKSEITISLITVSPLNALCQEQVMKKLFINPSITYRNISGRQRGNFVTQPQQKKNRGNWAGAVIQKLHRKCRHSKCITNRPATARLSGKPTNGPTELKSQLRNRGSCKSRNHIESSQYFQGAVQFPR